MGIVRRHFLYLLFIVLLLVPVSISHAKETPLVIFNEIAWAGSSSSSADEWVELKNKTNQIIDLKNWKICNLVKDPDCIDPMVTVDQGEIAPSGNFLIANNGPDHLFTRDGEKVPSILNVDPDIVDSSLSLSNENFKIALLNDQGEIVDVAGDGSKPFYGGEIGQKYYSMQRGLSASAGEAETSWEIASQEKNLDSFDFDIASPENSGAPKIGEFSIKNRKHVIGDQLDIELNYTVFDSLDDLEKINVTLINSSATITSSRIDFGQTKINFGKVDFCPTLNVDFVDATGLTASSQIDYICLPKTIDVRFSEILPHPGLLDFNGDFKINSDDEWIEITNYSQDEINLEGWTIAAPNEEPYEIGDISLPYSRSAVFYKSETKISLNDSGDSLELRDPFGKVIDRVVISSSSSLDNFFPDGNIDISGPPLFSPTGSVSAVNIQFENPITAEEARNLLSSAPGIEVIDDPANAKYPMPLFADGSDEVYVGRIRQDTCNPNTLDMWVVSDNIRKGAALNAIQIAEYLVSERLI